MSIPIVRPAQLEDSVAILELVASAFGRADEARMVRQLKSYGAVAGEWVAEDDGEIVGHVLLSPVFIIGNDQLKGACLAPLSVADSHRRQGLGARLARAGVTALRISGFDFAVVLGDPDYYRPLGFDPVFGRRFETPWPEAGDAFMAVPLSASGTAAAGGALVFADALKRIAAEDPATGR